MRFIKCGRGTAGHWFNREPSISGPGQTAAFLIVSENKDTRNSFGFRCDSAQGGGGDPRHICKILMTQCTYSNLLFFQDSFYLIIF